jgi:hypothetical protein
MTLTDGAIMFGACCLSFILGYFVGVFRVSRFVRKELVRIGADMEQQRKELQQFISKLGEEENKQ